MRLAVIIQETYLALRSRGLFWVSLWISVVLVLMMAGTSASDSGWSLMFGVISQEADYFTGNNEWARSLHLGLFRGIIDWWIMGFAVVLGLFTTANILPATLQSGMVDFYLAKSVSRLGLLFGKYVGSLLVVLVQVSVVAIGGLLVIALRLGEWHWELLWCVPLAVLLFAYLSAFQLLMAVVTRSSVGALLCTFLFWGFLWSLQFLASHLSDSENRQALQGLGKGIAQRTDTMAQQAHVLMQILPKTKATGELFDGLVRKSARYSIFETLVLRRQFESDASFEASLDTFPAARREADAAEEDGDGRIPAWQKGWRYIIGSSLGFTFAVFLAAYGRLRRIDF